VAGHAARARGVGSRGVSALGLVSDSVRGMLRVGLTGGIGSGKSEVARRLAALGAVVIDADQLAREVVQVGSDGLAEVVAEFGTDVLQADGSLDRAALGRIVFSDEDARRRLEKIIHPRVRTRAAEIESAVAQQAAKTGDHPVVVHVIPLLVETGQAGRFDVVIVVDTPEDVQIERLRRTRGMSEEEARARIDAQASREERLRAADIVLDNSGELPALDTQVEQAWQRLTTLAAEDRDRPRQT